MNDCQPRPVVQCPQEAVMRAMQQGNFFQDLYCHET